MTTLTAARIADVAYAEGFRGDRLVVAVAVAFAESSGRVEVVNYIGCVGLWQINQPVHVRAHPNWTRSWLQNARNNARAAFVLSSGGANWRPWSAYTNGSYRKFLDVARRAAGQVGPAPAPKKKPGGGGGSSSGGPRKGNLDDGKPRSKPRRLPGVKKAAPPPPPPRVVEEDHDPKVRLGNLFVHGTKLGASVQEAVTSATLSWATDQVTQLSLNLIDEDFDLWDRAEFEKGTRMIYREPGLPELVLRINAVTLDGGPVGTGGLTVAARSEGVWKLKQRQGPKVMRKASPSDFVRAECKAAGLKAVCESTSTRAQVKRDTGKGEGGSKPSSWSTFQRLASEVGFYVFEFAGTVYFGRPTWLINQTWSNPLQVALPGHEPEAWESRTMPSFSMSDDADVKVEISGIELPMQRFNECRPGKAVQIRGLDPFTDLYLTTSMSVPLLGPGSVSLTASSPKNPAKQPPQRAGGGGGGGSSSRSRQRDEEEKRAKRPSTGGGGAPKSAPVGARSALRFTQIAMSASNARYVYGGEASIRDPSPSVLDCSELIQWALGRMGVTFVDGSANQIAATRRIPVSQAMRTRGALLYKYGHIGISLGNGRSVEARNPSAGVGVFNAHDIAWTAGGLVPALRYG